MTATLIDGAAIAKEIRSEVAEGVAEMKTGHGVVPGLAVVLVGDDPASAVYVRNKERAAGEVEMLAEVMNLPADTAQDELLRALDRLNADDRIHGIIVQGTKAAPRNGESGNSNRARERREKARKLEDSIAEVETAIASLEGRMAVPGFYDDASAAADVVATHESLKVELDRLYTEWESLAAESERL